MSAKTNRSRQSRSVAARARRREAARNPGAASAAATPPMDPPFGYRVGEDGELEPHPEEVAVVERMRALAEARLGIGAIAEKLNADGTDARGNPWDTRTVSRILRRKVEQRFITKDGETRRAAREARGEAEADEA